ncbi:protein of unknown function [Streptantibioticus cattleyicolor NRRL 8057 = DSM 46488]|nr:protein of unknown function [Streptantibioticus cattleyicolor NRRL 8057 = DSM 46488]
MPCPTPFDRRRRGPLRCWSHSPAVPLALVGQLMGAQDLSLPAWPHLTPVHWRIGRNGAPLAALVVAHSRLPGRLSAQGHASKPGGAAAEGRDGEPT